MKSCSSREVRGEEIARIGEDWRLREELTGRGGRRRCSTGIRTREGAAGGRRWWSGCGERWGGLGAREGESERIEYGGVNGEARAGRERQSVARQGGKGGEEGGPAAGCHAAREGCGAWPRPAGGAWQQPERGVGGDVRRTRAAGRDTERGGELTGGSAQCRAAAPLTGGSGLSAFTGERGAWRAVARGPAREGKEMGRPDAQ
jgi:hypothetical protein